LDSGFLNFFDYFKVRFFRIFETRYNWSLDYFLIGLFEAELFLIFFYLLFFPSSSLSLSATLFLSLSLTHSLSLYRLIISTFSVFSSILSIYFSCCLSAVRIIFQTVIDIVATQFPHKIVKTINPSIFYQIPVPICYSLATK
jgi:hypothetical protein